MTLYGRDVSAFPDLDPTMTIQPDTQRVVAEAVARRFITPRGSLFYDPSYGLDIRLFLSEGFTNAKAFRLATAMENEALKDERVGSFTAIPTFVFGPPASLKIHCVGTTADSDAPFKFTLSVSTLTASLLVP